MDIEWMERSFLVYLGGGIVLACVLFAGVLWLGTTVPVEEPAKSMDVTVPSTEESTHVQYQYKFELKKGHALELTSEGEPTDTIFAKSPVLKYTGGHQFHSHGRMELTYIHPTKEYRILRTGGNLSVPSQTEKYGVVDEYYYKRTTGYDKPMESNDTLEDTVETRSYIDTSEPEFTYGDGLGVYEYTRSTMLNPKPYVNYLEYSDKQQTTYNGQDAIRYTVAPSHKVTLPSNNSNGYVLVKSASGTVIVDTDTNKLLLADLEVTKYSTPTRSGILFGPTVTTDFTYEADYTVDSIECPTWTTFPDSEYDNLKTGDNARKYCP